MTSNQLAYQANKIKAQEAETNRQRQEIATSQHLHDYGHIMVPAANSKVSSGGSLFGIKQFVDAAKAWKDIVGAGSLLASAR